MINRTRMNTATYSGIVTLILASDTHVIIIMELVLIQDLLNLIGYIVEYNNYAIYVIELIMYYVTRADQVE